MRLHCVLPVDIDASESSVDLYLHWRRVLREVPERPDDHPVPLFFIPHDVYSRLCADCARRSVFGAHYA